MLNFSKIIYNIHVANGGTDSTFKDLFEYGEKEEDLTELLKSIDEEVSKFTYLVAKKFKSNLKRFSKNVYFKTYSDQGKIDFFLPGLKNSPNFEVNNSKNIEVGFYMVASQENRARLKEHTLSHISEIGTDEKQTVQDFLSLVEKRDYFTANDNSFIEYLFNNQILIDSNPSQATPPAEMLGIYYLFSLFLFIQRD